MSEQTVSHSLGQLAWTRLRQNRTARVAAGVLLSLVILIIVGPWLSPHDAAAIDFLRPWNTPPALDGGHWFGTDSLGRDLFARTLEGGRLSLLVGLVSTLVSLGIGVAWGAVAGYFGGRLDGWMMRAVDVLYALPFLFFVILLTVFFGRHLVLIFIAIGLVNWLDLARIVRGQTLSLRHREFVAAARAAGLGDADILRRHIVPNLAGVVAVYITLTLPQVILTESFLSFLGLGVQEPAASWGALISDGAADMESAPWALMFPTAFLALTLLCCNFIGDALRDALDPKNP
ncbi:MAG: ABC transporter permease subunit [Pseudomonadota bacterium]